MATEKSSLPEAVAWQELLEETLADTELLNLIEAITRGNFASPCADMWLGSHMRDIKVSQRPRSTYGMHPDVVSRI